MEVAFRSSRTRTTMPLRMRRTIGSPASERALQVYPSPFTFRQTPLTVSLPIVPPNKAEERSAHLARVGAGQVADDNQSVGGQRAELIGPHRLALPFRRPALGGVQWGAGHRDFDRPERSCSERVRLPWRRPARPAPSSLLAKWLRP